MPIARILVTLAIVVVAAAATLWLASGLASTGAPGWQVAMGPILLTAFLAARWYGSRK
jgi:hypothetical protein